MKIAQIFIILISTLLASCVGAYVPIQSIDKTGIDVVLAAAKLPVVSDEKAKTMQVIGEVVGYSCKNQTIDTDATKVGAMDQTKIVAVQRGALAITELVCKEDGLSFVKNCWHSWECRATALH